MADIRELLLARLTTLIGSLPEFKDVRRNSVVDERLTPAAIILDGDEERLEDERGLRFPNAGSPMQLRPEIYLRAGAEPTNVGQRLSELRAAVIVAVLNDDAPGGLIEICRAGRGQNGRIKYEGLATSFAAGRAMSGDAHLTFSFVYPFKPDDLA